MSVANLMIIIIIPAGVFSARKSQKCTWL